VETQQTVGLYLDTATILNNPGYLEALQEQLGLNLVILGFSGQLPQHVLDLSPYDSLPPTDTGLQQLLARHIDGRPSATSLESVRQTAGPHMHLGGSDAQLRQAIEQIQRLGIRVWLLGGGWTANDFDVVMFCPSKERINRWYEAVYTHMATQYGVDGVDITHARFPMTSFPRGMFLCTCEDCAAAADSLGFDMAHMVADIHSARERLAEGVLLRLAPQFSHGLGAIDLFQLLGMPSGVCDWFTFRARLLERNVARFRAAVHAAAGEDFVFGIDTYPASLALFVGHDQTRWDRFSDFASPLVSHLDIFPMQTLAAWTRFLLELCPQWNETDALRLLYRLVGYDSLGLPDRIAQFVLGQPDCEFRNMPLAEFVLLDTAKARLCLPPDMPSYPIIQGGGSPHLWPRAAIDTIIQGIREQGHQGYMLQGAQRLVDFPLQP
jgi:hypothetical protein